MQVPALSAVELEVVSLVADGRTQREIAEALRLSPKTVEWHVARARLKLDRAAALRERLDRTGASAKEERWQG